MLDPCWNRHNSFVMIDHEIFSTIIFSLPLIQEGQFSFFWQRVGTNTC